MNVFPTPHEKLITSVLLAFAFGTLAGLLVNINDDHPEVAITALATLAAAFIGAWYAFKIQNQHEVLEQKRRNVEAANRAIFTVYTIWRHQKSYQNEVIAPCRGAPEIWLHLKPTPTTNFGRTSFDVERLDFLLSSQHAPVYNELLLEESRYEIFRQQVERRNDLVLNKLRPAMVELKITAIVPKVIPDIERELGPDLTSNLKSVTESIIKFNDEDINSLETLYPRLRTAFESMYPHQDFITINFDE